MSEGSSMVATNNAFISYRRETGYAWAKLVWDALDERGVDTFLDLESLRGAGTFDLKILNQIAGRPYFVLILTQGTLERCANDGDWLWREIEHAVATERVIVPMVVAPFSFEEADEFLPPEAADVLRSSNGLQVVPDYFDAAIDRLIEDRLVPTEAAVDQLTDDDRAFAGEAVARAKELDDNSAALRRAIFAGDDRDDGPADAGDARGAGPENTIETGTEVDPHVPTPPEEVAAVARAVPVPPPPDIVLPEPALPEPVPPEPAPSQSAPPDIVPSQPAPSPDIAPSNPAAEPAPPPVAPDTGRSGKKVVAIGAGVVLLLVAVAFGLVAALSGDDGPTDELLSGASLESGEHIESSDGRHVLLMTEHGELIAHTDGSIWWDPGEPPVPGSVAEMQTDGNFVVYPSNDDQDGDTAIWHASTHEHPGAFLRIGDLDGGGVIEIVDPDRGVIWRQTQQHPEIAVEPEQTPMPESGSSGG